MNTTTKNKPSIETLAATFSSVITDWLSAADIDAINTINARPGYVKSNLCASHEFCDANEAMLQACTALDYAPDIANDDDTALLNAAWNIAKQCEFNQATIENLDRR